jgi:type IV pilus assembly protein PilE
LASKEINNNVSGKDGIYRCRRHSGFSLLELVIVTAVIGTLLTIAIPSYQQYTQRAHRSEAIRIMLAIAGCQERVRSDTGFYDTSRCKEGYDSDSHELRIEPPDSAASLEFVIIAEPQPGRDDSCGSLSLNQAGTRGISGDPEALIKCWSGR